SSQVDTFDTPLFDSAVLDVDDLAHTYGVLVFADSSANDLHVTAFALEFFIELLVGHVMRFRRDFQGGQVDVEVNTALELDPGAFCILHVFYGNYFRIYKAQLLAKFNGSSLGNSCVDREHHG